MTAQLRGKLYGLVILHQLKLKGNAANVLYFITCFSVSANNELFILSGILKPMHAHISFRITHLTNGEVPLVSLVNVFALLAALFQIRLDYGVELHRSLDVSLSELPRTAQAISKSYTQIVAWWHKG